MEYHSSIKKKEILLFVTTWKDLEGLMLSEISQTEKNIVCFHLYVQSKRANLTEIENRMVVVGKCWSKGTNFQLQMN